MSISRNTPSKDQSELLYKLYYDDNMMLGRDRLYKYIKEKYPEYNISRRMVWHFISRQEIAQRFAPAKQSKNIQHTVLDEPRKQIGIDLIDMTNYEYKGYKYILTGIDLFSKKAFARPLKNKEEPTATKAMKDLIDNEIHYVSSIRSDRGSEFINKGFIDMLDKYKIKSVLSLAGKPQSNGNIERFNKTLKRALMMIMTYKKNHNWVDPLQEAIENYNKTYQTTIQNIPDDIDIEDDKDVLENVHDNIHNKVTSRNENEDVKFIIGDKVRIKLDEDDRLHGENWSKETYTVYKVHKPKSIISSPYYYIRQGKEKMKNKFYNNDLLYIPDILNKIDAPQKYEISKLIKPLIHNKEQSYEVKWRGYRDKDNTIEPRDDLLEDAPKLIRTYERIHNVKWANGRVTYEE